MSTDADGRLALTAVQGGLLRLWDLATGQCLRELDCGEAGVPEADLGADGRRGARRGPRRCRPALGPAGREPP